MVSGQKLEVWRKGCDEGILLRYGEQRHCVIQIRKGTRKIGFARAQGRIIRVCKNKRKDTICANSGNVHWKMK